MSYLSEVLADSPSMVYPMSTYSSGFADSSGNSRGLDTLSGVAPAATATGPNGAAAGAWGASAGFLRTSYTQTSDTTGTHEFWFKYASAPAANLVLTTFGPNSGANGAPTYVALLTTGKLSFSVQDGSGAAVIDSPSALSTGVWHHVVCSWGTGGTVMRVDKSTLVTGAKTSALARATSSYRVHGYWSGSANILQTGAVDMAWAAFYPSKLSDARTDAHYDAMFVVDQTVNAVAATATAAGRAPVVAANSGVAAPAAEATAAAIPPVVTATGDSVVLAPAATAAAAALPPGVTAASTVAATPASASAAGIAPTVAASVSATVTAPAASAAAAAFAPFVDNGSPDATVEAPPATATAEALAPLLALTPAIDTSNSFTGRTRGGFATVEVLAPVAEPPDGVVLSAAGVDIAIPFPTPTLVKGRPTNLADVRAVRKDGCTDRVMVNGKDITWFRATDPGDAPTRVPGYQLTEPFGYGASQPLTIPRTNSLLGEKWGYGELAWLKQGAKVQYQRVKPDGGIVTDYRGIILAIRSEGGEFVCDVAGEMSARASLIDKQTVLSRDLYDLGSMVSYAVRGLGFSLSPRFPVTGLMYPNEGNTTMLSWLQKLGALSRTSESPQRAVMPKVWGGKTWEFAEKDTTTVDLTLYADGARVAVNLLDDVAEQPNTVFGSGVTPDGERWRNAKYPNLFQGPAPQYPIAGGAAFGIGTTNADTIDGDGIETLKIKLAQTNYLGDEYSTGDTYTAQVAAAVNRLREDAGLSPLNGEMTLAGWNALWSLDVAGYSTEGSKILPIAQTSSVRVYNRASNGAILGRNPSHVAGSLRVDRTIDYGVIEPDQAARHAKSIIYGTAGHQWAGTITLNGVGAFLGEHDGSDWDTLDSADLMPARSIRPGMNVWLPYFDGGTLLHISGVDITPATGSSPVSVSLTVSTAGLDIFDLVEALKRNAESRRNVYREWRVSNLGVKPSGNFISRDEWFGKVWQNVPLVGGAWNIVEIVAGQSGTVNRTNVIVDGATEFCVAAFSREITPARLNAIAGDPFAYDENGLSTFEHEWAERFFDQQLLRYVAGQGDQPGGYGWKKGYNADGERTANPLIGTLVDDATWSYGTDPRTGDPLVWVAIYPRENCTLRRGRLLYALEDDVT